MKKSIIGIVAIALIAAMMVIPAAAFEPGECDITVCASGCDHSSIQSAVDVASAGDTICVYNGTYNEAAIRIMFAAKRNITLKGEGADVVTLDAGGGSDNIGIGGDSMENGASGGVVAGFKMINSQKGIEIASFAPDCIIRNCVFDGASFSLAISLAAANTTFMNNVITNAPYELGAVEITRPTTFINNVVRDSTGIYGAVCIECDDCTIANNTIVNNTGAGILLMTATSPVANNIITKNNISSNGYGFFLYDAGSDNKIYLNDIVDNGVTATTFGTTPPAVTYWNSTEQITYTYNPTYTNFLGNYWGSAYTGTDADGDGLGDTPYVVPDSLGEDYRPLMEPFENYPEAAAGICGDVNEDGDVTVLDATKVKNRAGNPSYPLDDEWAADVNCDTFINVLDATKVMNRAGNPGYPLSCCT